MIVFLVVGVLIYAGFVALTWVSAAVHKDQDPLPQVTAIIVVSGPGANNTMPVGETRERVERGVALWHEGLAPIIVMSGAGPRPAIVTVPDSRPMRWLAESLDVPSAAIVEEDRSYSTLQNALRTASLPEISTEAPIILVTSRRHLARAWASFWWGGFSDITVVASDDRVPSLNYALVMQGAKWIFNIGRASLASGAYALGIDEAKIMPWLE